MSEFPSDYLPTATFTNLSCADSITGRGQSYWWSFGARILIFSEENEGGQARSHEKSRRKDYEFLLSMPRADHKLIA